MERKAKPKRPQSRLARTLRSLAYISIFGIVLAAYNAFSLGRDTGIATGAPNDGQRAFFIAAADRPDMPVFYKGLTPEQRLAIARNVANYDDPKIPKLIGVLLGDFDAEARAELAKSLTQLAPKQPKSVAEQLALKGSFQRLAVFDSLRSIGNEALPHVVEMLANADARPNAIAFLVEAGPAAIPLLLPKIDDESADVRVAAADALGKLRAVEAVDRIVELYRQSEIDVAAKPEEQPLLDARATYMTALGGIAAPQSREFLSSIAQNPEIAPSLRSQASLGLGRLGGSDAIQILWRLSSADEPEIRDGARSALRIAGDEALKTTNVGAAERLFVAAGIESPLADQVILSALNDPVLAVSAAQAAAGRPRLVEPMRARLSRLDAATSGDLADAIVRALAASDQGRAALDSIVASDDLRALIERRTG